MKKVLFISAVVLLAAACHKEPFSQDSDGDYLVYTSPAKDFDFSLKILSDILTPLQSLY